MTIVGRMSRAAGVVALLALGALALHELRYMLAFGGGADAALERTGHGYLELLAPLVAAVAVAAVIVSVVAPAALRLSPALGADDSGLTERAAAYAAALLAVHLTQELAEALVHGGHAGIAQALGAGGLAVLPLAMALGALAAFARGWLDRAERGLVTALDREPLPRAPRGAGAPIAPRPARRPLASLGLRFGIARRPPPLAARA